MRDLFGPPRCVGRVHMCEQCVRVCMCMHKHVINHDRISGGGPRVGAVEDCQWFSALAARWNRVQRPLLAEGQEQPPQLTRVGKR